MTTHFPQSWSSKMSFQRKNKRSNSPNLSQSPTQRLSPAKSTAGLKQLSPLLSSQPNTSLSLTEKDFAEKGKTYLELELDIGISWIQEPNRN